MRTLILAFLANLGVVAFANAATIQFTFTGVDGSMSLDGGATANGDISIILTGDTNDFVGSVGFGARGYNNLSAVVSSTSLGLTNVAVNDTMWLYINATAFGPGGEDSVLLQANGSGTVNGLFNGGGAFAAFDGVSDLAAVFAPAASTGALVLSLANGSILSIVNLDNAMPFGDSSFSAQIVPLPGAIPLFIAGFASLGLMRRRRQSAHQ